MVLTTEDAQTIMTSICGRAKYASSSTSRPPTCPCKVSEWNGIKSIKYSRSLFVDQTSLTHRRRRRHAAAAANANQIMS